MSKANFFLKFIQNNPLIFQKRLQKILRSEKLEIKELRFIKDRIITRGKHKITVFLRLKNFQAEKTILEIHDDLDCFKRNLFAQTELRSLVNSPKVFAQFNPLSIVREYIDGDYFFNLISERKINFREILRNIKRSSEILVSLHQLKTHNLPKFLFKDLNLTIEKKFLRTSFKFLVGELKPIEHVVKKNIDLLIRKMIRIDNQNRISLIHADYTPANLILTKQKMHLVDFDDLEVGNPGRDLGKFICHLEYWLNKIFSKRKTEEVKNLFLEYYFTKNKPELKPDLETNINLHYAEMLTYILIEKFFYIKRFGKKIEDLEEIDSLSLKIRNILSSL